MAPLRSASVYECIAQIERPTYPVSSISKSLMRPRYRRTKRAHRCTYTTIGYNALDAVVSIIAGLFDGSVALVGLGVDSAIEVTDAGAAQWPLRADLDSTRRERVERITLRRIGGCFLALAAYVLYDSGKALWLGEQPRRGTAGVVILVLSVLVMPLFARAKRRVAQGLARRALAGDARQMCLYAYLSTIALTGVVLNALVGWWWADPVAALAMVPIIAKEGVEWIRAEHPCEGCA